MSGARAYDGPRRALAVGAATAAALGLLGACGDDGEPTVGEARAAQVREALVGSELAADVVDVLARAAAGTAGTYRVTYELATTDGDSQEVALTQRPPDRRLDVRNADGTADVTISTDGAIHQCRLDGAWSCSEIGAADEGSTGGLLDADEVAALGRELADSTDRFDLGVERREIVGVDATCLVARLRPGLEPDEGEGTVGTLCVSAEGAVLLTEQAGEVLTALDYRADVPEDAFDLPA